MIQSETVFVIGAGASQEANLPTGAELKSRIARLLGWKFRHPEGLSSGDPEILQALRDHIKGVQGARNDIEPYIKAGHRIRDAMPQALSIDNFIEAHEDDHSIELCGKLAIVKAIANAEQNSLLFDRDTRHRLTINHSRLTETWFCKFFQIISEGISTSSIENIFKHIAFVIFNYDRCIEHYLIHAIKNYYAVPDDELIDLIQLIPIIHPYGTIGKLPWQESTFNVPFGGELRGQNLLTSSSQIRTFTERVEDENSLEKFKHRTKNASRIVFLGFGFNQQNMRLLELLFSNDAREVFATGKGISDSDLNIVSDNILKLFDKRQSNRRVIIKNHFHCKDIFSEYWRILGN